MAQFVDVPLMYTTSGGLIDKPLAVKYIEANYPGVDLTKFYEVAKELDDLYDHELTKVDLFHHVQMALIQDEWDGFAIGLRYDRILKLLNTYLCLPINDTSSAIATEINNQRRF